jgi:hypothetical protein
MIFKDSLLDAYMTLDGSYVQHIAMLIVMLMFLDDPSKIKDERLSEEIKHVYTCAIVTHSLCALF